MPFVLKLTQSNTTRRVSYQSIPSFDDVNNSITRLFNINKGEYYLSKLLFSPTNLESSGRILISSQVHSQKQYDDAIAPVSRHSNGQLRLTVVRYSLASPQQPHPPSIWSSTGSLTPPSEFPVPPPPILYPDINFQFDRNVAQSPQWNPLPQPSSYNPRPSSCCSVSEGKAEVQALITKFKGDLDEIVSTSFSTPNSSDNWRSGNFNMPPYSPVIPPMDRPYAPSPRETYCTVCTKRCAGDSYACRKCLNTTLCVDCYQWTPSTMCFSATGILGPHVFVRQSMVSPDNIRHPSTFWSESFESERPRFYEPPSYPPFLPPPPIPQPPRFTNWNVPNTPTVPFIPVMPPSPFIPAPRVFSPLAQPRAPPPPPPPPAVHVGVVCDSCDRSIVGTRHKCDDCADYDLCDSCMADVAATHPFHTFTDIRVPRSIHCTRNIFSGEGQRCPARQTARRSRSRSPPPAAATETAPAIHAARCDLCDSNIVGNRYKCLKCPDFDTCASCFSITPDQHPGHSFVKVSKPEDYLSRGHSYPPHHFAECDGCNAPIRGVRFKCMHPHCADYDLCESCESHPIPLHDQTHPMLKMRDPHTVIPTVYRFGQSTIIPQRNVPAQSFQPPVNNPQYHAAPQGTVSPQSPYSQANPLGRNTLDAYHVYASPVPSVDSAPETPLPAHAEVDTHAASTEVTGCYPFGYPLSANPAMREETGKQSRRKTVSFEHNIPHLRHDGELPPGFWQTAISESAESTATADSLLCRSPSNASSQTQHADTYVAAPKLENPFNYPNNPFMSDAAPAESPLTGLEALLNRPTHNESAPIVNMNVSLAALLNGYSSNPPSPPSSPPLDESVTVGDHRDAEDSQELPLACVFIADTTVPDGDVFPAGAEFIKQWRVLNNGKEWPESTELVFLAGEPFGHLSSIKIGAVNPGYTDVCTGELKAPDVPGRYVGYWSLADGEGNQFGDRMWIDIVVSEPARRTQGDESMSSSSIIMPPVSAIAASDNADVPSSAGTSASRLTSVDAHSDSGSDGSSISLISLPTSEDEDREEWEDSRSHASVDRLSGVLEYVVLYEDDEELSAEE